MRRSLLPVQGKASPSGSSSRHSSNVAKNKIDIGGHGRLEQCTIQDKESLDLSV
jgi:hypothetical protein